MKVFIAIPSMDTVSVDFVISLERLKRIESTSVNFAVGSLVYVARDNLASQAIMTGSDYILWLDSDMVFSPYLLLKLMQEIESGKDFVSGLYFRHSTPYAPVLYKSVESGEGFDDYPEEPFEIDGSGFGGVLMKVSMLKDIIDQEHAAFAPLPGYGEDLSFCIRAKRCGYRLWCDPRIKLGHVSKTIVTEDTYKRKDDPNGTLR